MSAIVNINNLKKYYEAGKIKALDGLGLEIEAGQFVAVTGPSGSGKSTLLNMVGGLDRPDSGTIVVAGVDLISQRDLAPFRSKTIGFIFQLHNLIPSLTALENVLLPMFEIKMVQSDKRERAKKLLEQVGMADRIYSYPPQLSGGERQRVAVARALVNSPEIVLADEPTGSLDSKNTAAVLRLLEDLMQKEGKTLLIITHEEEIASRARRIVRMLDGRVVEDKTL